MSSVLVARGSSDERRARLLKGAQGDVERLEAAAAAGWDVKADLEKARAYVVAFGGRP